MTGQDCCGDCGAPTRRATARYGRYQERLCPSCVTGRTDRAAGRMVVTNYGEEPIEGSWRAYRIASRHLGLTWHTAVTSAEYRALHDLWSHWLRVDAVLRRRHTGASWCEWPEWERAIAEAERLDEATRLYLSAT